MLHRLFPALTSGTTGLDIKRRRMLRPHLVTESVGRTVCMPRLR